MSMSSRIPEDLLEELDSRFPDQCPSIEDNDRQIWVKVGQRGVIEFLKKQFELQNRNVLNPTQDEDD